MRRRNNAAFVHLSVIVLLCACGAMADEPQALHLIKTIPMPGVEGRIDHMSIDVDRQRVFVAALGNNSVEVIDSAGGTVATSIGHIREPQGVVYIPESQKLAVASGGDGNMRIYDHALKLIGTVDGLDDADNVRYDPKSKLLYVGYGSGALAVIDPEKAVKVADIKLDGHPESFRLETAGSRIFVNVPHAGEIEVVDRSKREVVVKWPLKAAQANFPMILNEDNHRLFIGCREPAKVLVLDSQTGHSVAEVDCVGDADDLFYDADQKRIYVSGGAGSITVIESTDADHYQLAEHIPTASGARTSFFSPQRGELYVAVPHRGSQQAEVRVYKVQAAK